MSCVERLVKGRATTSTIMDQKYHKSLHDLGVFPTKSYITIIFYKKV